MRAFVWTILILTAVVTGCSSSGEIVYTGQNEDAREGDYIKDPNARASTHDGRFKDATTRTDSNRVDIPVLEFAQLNCRSELVTWHRSDALKARMGRLNYTGARQVKGTTYRTTVEQTDRQTSWVTLYANANETLYPAFRNNEMLNTRSGRERYRAYSGEARPWIESGRVWAMGGTSNAWLEADRANEWVEAVRSNEYLEGMTGARVIGIHLWKYADRDLVTNEVVVTYTLVYYNTNEYDTGPTQILEPVPYFTDYIPNSATLPRNDVKVDFIDRENARDQLRWTFPKGIKAGETGRMKYQVRVKLDGQYGPE